MTFWASFPLNISFIPALYWTLSYSTVNAASHANIHNKNYFIHTLKKVPVRK